MLGKCGNSAYKYAEDFKNHKDYLNYMYGNTKGFITRSVIPQDKIGAYYETFAYADRLINKNSYYGMTNVYTSMNTFMTKRKREDDRSGRKVENVKKLNALYLDLDCYKIGMTQEQVLCALEEEYFGSKIPTPTFVINSGRGLYLIWKIEEDRNALPRWTMCEKYLFEQCKEFNADPQALDAARILRVPFTVNGKNGEQVRIMRFNDINYTLHEIIKEYEIKPLKWEKKAKAEPTYPYGEATAKQRRVAQWQAANFNIELPNFENYEETFKFIKKYSHYRAHGEDREEKGNVILFAKAKTIATMLDGRVNDLFKLFSMRKGEDCCREYALFLCRLWCAERSNDFDFALEQTLRLNDSFDVPFTKKYVECRTKSAETKLKSGRTYNYGKSTLIRVLGITEEEQKELEYLCLQPTSEKARRAKNNRRAYLTRLEKAGSKTKAEAVHDRREAIAFLLSEGKSKEEICLALEISSRTFDRDKAVIVSNGLLERVKATVKDKAEEIMSAAKETAKQLKSKVETLKNAVSPFFKYTNYKRTPYGCSAHSLGSRDTINSYTQLSIWDIWENTLADCDSS